MRLFVLNVSLSALAINVSSILRTRTFVQTRKLETFLAGSKHLASQSRDEPKIEEEEEDPKKLEMLQRLGIDKDDSQCKTGAQLRKERKLMNKVKTKKNRGAHSAKSTNVVQTNRFVLGNGIEALNPTTLLGLVGSTAPYLFPDNVMKLVLDEDEFDDDGNELNPENDKLDVCPQLLVEAASGSMGWENILSSYQSWSLDTASAETQRIAYFALCLASHFATVATFVPTDVDSKIRGHCWYVQYHYPQAHSPIFHAGNRQDPSSEVIEVQFAIVKKALQWDVEKVSKRWLRIKGQDEGRPISGHDGEWLGVLTGAWGAFLKRGRADLAAEAEHLIVTELQREANIFHFVRQHTSSVKVDTTMLKLAAILTHNVGDVDQGLSYWDVDLAATSLKGESAKFSRLAHERGERFGGEFLVAKDMYRPLLSAEGHRNYPLREARCLRSSPDLMLPLGPWLENWGRLVGTHPGLSHEDRVQVARQLLRGCDSTSRAWCVPNQVGYYRALHGLASVANMELITKDLDKDCRTALKEHQVRLHLGLSDEAFASRLGRQARDILGD